MTSKQLIKHQDSPRKRIIAQSKVYAKNRLGIQASDRDITTKDFFYAVCDYIEQLEAALLYVQTKVEKKTNKE